MGKRIIWISIQEVKPMGKRNNYQYSTSIKLNRKYWKLWGIIGEVRRV